MIQGLTEFLPISSDGHLALAHYALGMTPDLTFEVFLHAATLLAMFWFFRADLVRIVSSLLPRNRERFGPDRALARTIFIGTFVTGIVALILEPVVEPMASSLVWVGVWFLGTSLVLAGGEYFAAHGTVTASPETLPLRKTALIAVMQGLAVLPGLSRSGSTIAGGIFAGLTRESAARFSFLLGMPIITLAALKDAVDLVGGVETLPSWPVSLAGFIASGISGYLAIGLLMRLVRTRTLWGFAAYTAIAGTGTLLFGIISGKG